MLRAWQGTARRRWCSPNRTRRRPTCTRTASSCGRCTPAPSREPSLSSPSQQAILRALFVVHAVLAGARKERQRSTASLPRLKLCETVGAAAAHIPASLRCTRARPQPDTSAHSRTHRPGRPAAGTSTWRPSRSCVQSTLARRCLSQRKPAARPAGVAVRTHEYSAAAHGTGLLGICVVRVGSLRGSTSCIPRTTSRTLLS